MRAAVFCVAVLVLAGSRVRAQSGELPVTDEDLAAYHFASNEGTPAPATTEDFTEPLPGYPDALGEPPWCESPYRQTSVRIGSGINLTTSKINGDGYTFWTEDAVPSSRIVIGGNNSEGLGWRAQFWNLHEKVRLWNGDVDVDASTLYVDVDRLFYYGSAEFTVGGGIAGARLALDHFREDQFIGAGGSIFGEGFLPFLRFTKSDIGLTGRARLALLGGIEDDIIHNRIALIDDVGWGMEFRRRFGAHQEKYWYINVEREVQLWQSGSNMDAADEVFQGTSLNFGLAR